MNKNKYTSALILLTAITLLFSGCKKTQELELDGEGIGVPYHIKIVTDKKINIDSLQEQIDKRLYQINKDVSIYDPKSEISKFNNRKNTEPFKTNLDINNILVAAKFLYKLTDGALDITIKPVIDEWGFGKKIDNRIMPTDRKIAELMKHVGFNKVDFYDDMTQGTPIFYLRKKDPESSIDLSSIVQGYAADRISDLLVDNELQNFMVDIGGEIITKGLNLDKAEWSIGINTPKSDSTKNEVYAIIKLSNKAIATSGTYRNYVDIKDHRYSHIFDPKTGKPVDTRIASVSVIAPNCTIADGLATAFMVLGVEASLELIKKMKNIEALFITVDEDGQLEHYQSSGFPLKIVSN